MLTNSKLSNIQANSKCTSSPSLFPVLYLSTVPLYCTLVDYPNLTGSQFSSTRTIFIFQVECALKYMLLFRPNFILSVLNPIFSYVGFYCITSILNWFLIYVMVNWSFSTKFNFVLLPYLLALQIIWCICVLNITMNREWFFLQS